MKHRYVMEPTAWGVRDGGKYLPYQKAAELLKKKLLDGIEKKELAHLERFDSDGIGEALRKGAKHGVLQIKLVDLLGELVEVVANPSDAPRECQEWWETRRALLDIAIHLRKLQNEIRNARKEAKPDIFMKMKKLGEELEALRV